MCLHFAFLYPPELPFPDLRGATYTSKIAAGNDCSFVTCATFMAVKTVTPTDAQRPLFVGVDVGGTGIKIGIVDDSGRPLGRVRIVTEEERGPADAMARSCAAIAK